MKHSSSIASESCPLQTIEPIQQSFENDEVFIESLPSTSTATEGMCLLKALKIYFKLFLI